MHVCDVVDFMRDVSGHKSVHSDVGHFEREREQAERSDLGSNWNGASSPVVSV